MKVENNNILTEKEMVSFFIKHMKNKFSKFKYAEEINVNPQKIDFSYYDPVKKNLIGIEFKKKIETKCLFKHQKFSIVFMKCLCV